LRFGSIFFLLVLPRREHHVRAEHVAGIAIAPGAGAGDNRNAESGHNARAGERAAPFPAREFAVTLTSSSFLFRRGKPNMAEKTKRILLTGGAGFIGSHLAAALLRRGAELSIVDRLDHFYSPLWKKANLEEVRRTGSFEFFESDICETERMRETLAAARPNVIIHLAARAGVRPSIEEPRLYEHVNVAGTVNLLELCREYQVEKFIFGSSSSVYGMSSRAPFSEEQHELRPISPYAATKLAGEMFCYTYAHLYGLPAVCLRFFTVFGPRQRPDLAIHKFTARIERGEPLPIFGEGGTGRDYTYVDDIVAGVLAAIDYNPQPVDGAPFEVFNLGNSHPVKLTELIDMLERVTGKKAIREHKDSQPGDVPLTWADISKAERLLGYRPQTALEDGLRKFVAWYRGAAPGQRI
jgi:UDP-glucuronate 4-epimerase